MKINYFDLGLHKNAAEVDMFINICEKNKFEYFIWGFEAHPQYCVELEKKYSNNHNVKIINKAISNSDKPIKLYIADCNDGEGNSIFKTKNNVNVNKRVVVDGVLFSNWLKENVVNFEQGNNILRFNIEGAEWYLMNDLDVNDLLKYFNVFLGNKNDMHKVSELKNHINEYEKILTKNNVRVYKFTKDDPRSNCDLLKVIKENINEDFSNR